MVDKRVIILEQLKLGMAFDTAVYVAECTVEEIEELTKDNQFQARVEASKAILERDLLQSLHKAMEMNAAYGNSTEVRWMLERVNPKRWSTGGAKVIKGKGDAPFSFEVSFV